MAFGYFSALRARLLSNSSLAQESAFDGQTFFQSFFQETNVQNTPAFRIDNDFVRLFNFGQINTENAEAAISVTGENASIVNFGSGRIDADSGPDAQATAINVTGSASIRNFGSIDGEFNGVSFTGAQSSGRLDNFRGAAISSDSRAVNIDGEGVQVRNFGDILGTGDQRNGTIYANATAENFSIRNFSRATIDAGEGNQGAGISLEIGDEQGDVVQGTITNGFGATIQGRGQAASNTPLAGDGIRINNGAEGTVFQGDIINRGRIASESDQGTTGGIRVADGVGFDGSIVNGPTGVIEGVRNGLYIGNGEHDLYIGNAGTISSDSRAVNIDGSGVNLSNTGRILGTGDQRNGTVYADDTADGYTIYNGRSGVIDAGAGNNGSGVALQTGDIVGDVVTASVTNDGIIQGRGDAEGANGIGNGLRIFAGSDVAGTTGFAGDIVNNGLIAGSEDSPLAAGVSVESGVDVLGTIFNRGEIRGVENAIDAREGGSVNIVNDGLLSGNVLLGDEQDVIISSGGEIRGTVNAGGGDDVVLLGDEDNVVVGGLGDDVLDGGEGNDTAAFDDLNVGIVADLQAGTVSRSGFAADVAQQVLVNPNQGITNELAPSDIVSEAIAGNIYFNVHTTEFPAGEVRGQLELISDVSDGNGGRIVTLTAVLDGAQEVPAPVDTPATGTATVVFTISETGEVSYETDLDVSNLQGELLPVNIGNGTLSPIHLHNAPAGQNGPVVVDVATDAGEGLVLVDETDVLENIENVVGSGGDDQISGDDGDNTLTGGAGDDLLTGGAGNDVFVFAEGGNNDTITDFGGSEQDRLDVSAFGPEFDLESVIGGAIQDGEDTVITLSENDTVRLAGFDVGQLSEDDFIVFGAEGVDVADVDLGDGDGDDPLNVSGLGPDFDPESAFNSVGPDGDLAAVTLGDNDTVRVAGLDGDQQNQDDFIA